MCGSLCPKKKQREVVIVFPFNTQTKELFIIQEYIHHYDRKFWKFVSGGVDKEGASLLQHALEELAEEVGMQSDNLYHFHSSEKIFGNRGVHFYIAEDPVKMEHPPENPDTDYITDQKWINKEEFDAMLENHDLLWDQATMTATQMFKKYN